jgi:hypothetical protein
LSRLSGLKLPIVSLLALCLGIFTAGGVGAATSPFTLFGSATMVSNGVQLVSNAKATPPVYSGVAYTPPAPLTVGQLNTLSTSYQFTSGDCGLGSPRFAIDLSNGKAIFVYIGPSPNFTGCGTAQQNTGNLLTSPDLRCDTSQIIAGTQYASCSTLKTNPLLASLSVTDVALVSDNGASPSNAQTLIVNNVTVNGSTFTVVPAPTNKDQCKNGGWQTFNNPSFKNQGDCVSFVQTGGRNDGQHTSNGNGNGNANGNQR